MDNKLFKDFQGNARKIVHCKGAEESFWAEIGRKRIKASKAKSMVARLSAIIEKHANGDRLSKQNYRKEDKLPRRPGQENGYFYAIKNIPMRAYGWESTRLKRVFFISHYVYKNYDDLHPRDVLKVHENWKRIEECKDDY